VSLRADLLVVDRPFLVHHEARLAFLSSRSERANPITFSAASSENPPSRGGRLFGACCPRGFSFALFTLRVIPLPSLSPGAVPKIRPGPFCYFGGRSPPWRPFSPSGLEKPPPVGMSCPSPESDHPLCTLSASSAPRFSFTTPYHGDTPWDGPLAEHEVFTLLPPKGRDRTPSPPAQASAASASSFPPDTRAPPPLATV